MEEERRVEVATQLLLQLVAKKAKGKEPDSPGVMKRRLKPLAQELGVHYPTLNNFAFQLDIYKAHYSYGRKKEQTAVHYENLLRLAKVEDVAKRLLLNILLKEGVPLSLALRRELGRLSQATGISKLELAKFVRPLLHDMVDITTDLETQVK